MGTYINIGNSAFTRARNTEYIDKSALIAVVNDTLDTDRCFSCVSRSRRFGKSMAASMLCAYYDKSCDSRELFADLEIAKMPSFEQHLNKYRVLYLDLSKLVSLFKDNEQIVSLIQELVIADVRAAFPDTETRPYDTLSDILLRISEKHDEKFFLIVDEWDAICREFQPGDKAMDSYITWLRSMFKDINASRIFAGVYMTGIFPVKKYKTESALNNFWEYSMIDPGELAGHFGFRRREVEYLCRKYGMDYADMAVWYDGYTIGDEPSIFNPSSVIKAVQRHRCRSYWSATGSYDQVANYINMNIHGLKDDIILMLAGGRCHVDTTGFANDMHEVHTKDDVLTVLIHLGYLSYDWNKEECFIPNMEVRKEMANAIKSNNWRVAEAIDNSRRLLQDTLAGNEEAVAKGIEKVHEDETSILSYHDENSLSCVLSIAYYAARNDYVIHRELASGKGFADLVLIPRRHVDRPAIVLELKYAQNAETAIAQIKRKNYIGKVAEYTGEILFVGINYNKEGVEGKKHTCRIEKIVKGDLPAPSVSAIRPSE
ncbi:MAG: ATP-binding protein [Phocaeicola plebeius]|nr:ATP-binding protein [Phocaeicola plebeius]